jgi:hypothetical protein
MLDITNGIKRFFYIAKEASNVFITLVCPWIIEVGNR